MILICLNIGIGRAVLSELLDVGDRSHGKHLNIFVILTIIMIWAVFVPASLVKYANWIAIGIMAIYQMFLSCGVQDYILEHEKQDGFLNINMAGFAQTIGYFCCFLFGLALGRRFYEIDYEKEGSVKKMAIELVKVVLGSLILFLLSYFLVSHTAPRVTNFAYVLYCVLNISCSGIALLMGDRMMRNRSYNLILDGPGKTSRLIYFIVGNLLTGLIKVTVIDFAQTTLGSVVITAIYMFVLHLIFAILVIKKIKVRFW